MTQEEFVERHRHELAGLVLDAATAGRTGAEMAVWLRTVMRRIDAKLAAVYADAYPKPELNGPVKPPVKKEQPK